MRIREDLAGVVWVSVHGEYVMLAAGDEVPNGAVVDPVLCAAEVKPKPRPRRKPARKTKEAAHDGDAG